MKSGILTHHHILNDGAVLQSFAQSQSLSYPLIDMIFPGHGDISERAKLSGRYKAFKEFEKEYLNITEESLTSIDYQKQSDFISQFNKVVIGSDEVWKLKHGRWSKRFPNIYWGDPNIKTKFIAMAASANNLNYNKVSPEGKIAMARCLNSFELLGVRDSHTIRFLKFLGINDNRVKKICDPALAFDFPKLDLSEKLANLGIDVNKKIMLVRVPKKARKYVPYDKFKGYQIIGISKYDPYANYQLWDKLTPLEWANIFQYADIVFSNSYHATIFSLKNEVPIKVINVKSPNNKVYDLLNDFDLLSCYEKPSVMIDKFSVNQKTMALKKVFYYGFAETVSHL